MNKLLWLTEFYTRKPVLVVLSSAALFIADEKRTKIIFIDGSKAFVTESLEAIAALVDG